jgi:integrase
MTSRRQRKQKGQICNWNGRWYLRYYKRERINGTVERRRVCQLLGDVTTRGKRPPQAIIDEAENFIGSVNAAAKRPQARIIGLADFVKEQFLPRVQREAKPTTYNVRCVDWERLRRVIGTDYVSLGSVETCDVQAWFDRLSEDEPGLGRNTLHGHKSTISAIFKEAVRLGYRSSNPVRDVRVNPLAPAPSQKHAYTLEEIAEILSRLPEPAATIFALACFSGLRRSEIQGLEWTDLRDGQIYVSRAIVNGFTSSPKTANSAAPIPVLHPLAERLEMHRLRDGNPTKGPVFRSHTGKPLALANVIVRSILPALDRCKHCGASKGEEHLKSYDCPGFERNERIPQWFGLHACRRGLASNLNRMNIPVTIAQRVLRHKDTATTMAFYVKTVDADVAQGMTQFESNFSPELSRLIRGSNGAVDLDLDKTTGTVN